MNADPVCFIEMLMIHKWEECIVGQFKSMKSTTSIIV